MGCHVQQEVCLDSRGLVAFGGRSGSDAPGGAIAIHPFPEDGIDLKNTDRRFYATDCVSLQILGLRWRVLGKARLGSECEGGTPGCRGFYAF